MPGIDELNRMYTSPRILFRNGVKTDVQGSAVIHPILREPGSA